MKALICEGPGEITLAGRPKPVLQVPDDVVMRVMLTTICDTDLRIIKGDVLTYEPGYTLGHEGAGVVGSVGATMTSLQRGDHVLISCISSCGKCANCRRGVYSRCEAGG